MTESKASKIVFVSSHRRAPKVADRLVGALAAGRKVDLYAFDRGQIDHPVYGDPRITFFSLGAVDDGVRFGRLQAFFRAWLKLRSVRAHAIEPGTLIIVNSLEMLVMSWLSGLTGASLIYDVADIHVLLLAPSCFPRLARWLERRALRRVSLLIVSSPWFFWDYFLRWQHSKGPAMLIENKVGTLPANPDPRPRCSGRIAWNGLLRCHRSARVLLECLKQSTGNFHLSLHGSLTRLDDWGSKLSHNPHCSYSGHYAPQTLAALLADASFVWGVDYADGENSRWLLPNRLYEAIAVSVPLIAVRGSATAQVVAHYRIGIVLPECTPQAVLSAVLTCDPAHYNEWVENMRALRLRAQRGSEWQCVFAGREHWPLVGYLPGQPDINCVLLPSPCYVLDG